VEPLRVWRFFSKQARALLRIAAKLQCGIPGDEADWSIVLNDGVCPSKSAEKKCWCDAIRLWLHLGDVRPTIQYRNQTITWESTDLFGALAVQLALGGMQAPGQVHCTNCGKTYAPKKQIARGANHFCGNRRCQKVAAASRAARYRQNKKNPHGRKTSARKTPFRGILGARTDDPLFS
jgi:hypothetical protein